MQFEKLSKPYIGWCVICKKTHVILTHVDIEWPEFMGYICEDCAEKILDNE